MVQKEVDFSSRFYVQEMRCTLPCLGGGGIRTISHIPRSSEELRCQPDARDYLCNAHSFHGMARPWVADGGDDLQTWRVSANILNKQLWTTDKGWCYVLGV
jgi:hypothetical protein